MTKEERIEKLKQESRSKVTVGKRFRLQWPDKFLSLSQPKEGVFHVNAAHLTNESHDDDFGSFICDCHLIGQAHAHFRGNFGSFEEAAEAFAEQEQRLNRYQTPSLKNEWMPDRSFAL